MASEGNQRINIDPHMGDKRNHKLWYAGFISVAVIAMEVISLIVSFHGGGAGILRYYTVLSNLFALATSIALSLWFAFGSIFYLPRWLMILRYMASCCLTLTFVVVMVILLPMYAPYGLTKYLLLGVNLFQHLLCPILTVFSFAVLERDRRMTGKEMLIALIPTFAYAAVSIVLSLTTSFRSPYPFLQVDAQPWYASVLWIALVAAITIAIAWILRGRRSKKNV